MATDKPGPGWDGHLLLPHVSEEERLRGLAAWVRRGLERAQVTVAAAAAREPGVLVLHLAGVSYLAASAAQAIAAATRAFRGDGGRLLLIMPSAASVLVLQATGVDELPGVELVGSLP